MNTKQCLSIEQMQHLKELGVDTSKASVYWHRILRLNTGKVVTDWFKSFNKSELCLASMKVETVPTFILDDILDFLPKKLQHRYEDYELTAFYCHMAYEWKVQYLNNDISFMDYKSGENLIDAAYEMLCWVIENGYLETK